MTPDIPGDGKGRRADGWLSLILHRWAHSRHLRTDPACVHFAAPKPGSRLDGASRGLACWQCQLSRLRDALATARSRVAELEAAAKEGCLREIPGAVEAVARILDEQDMAGGGSRWNDADPPGWQSQDALRAAYRHMAAEVLAAAYPVIAQRVRAKVADEAAQDVHRVGCSVRGWRPYLRRRSAKRRVDTAGISPDAEPCRVPHHPSRPVGRSWRERRTAVTKRVDSARIERIVGTTRHETEHYARAVSSVRIVYILHSAQCLSSGIDLRDCDFSLALDRGINEIHWCRFEDRPIRVAIESGLLVPADAVSS